MSSLFGTISVSLSGLMAQQAALQTTSDNIANVNTPGYSRKRTDLVEDTTLLGGGASAGGGVSVAGVESLRDNVLELRMHQETQKQGELSGYIGAMSQVDTQFSDLTNGIGAQIDQFFNNVAGLSTDPASMTQRQSVLVSAGNLTSAFRTTAQNLKALQGTLDTGVQQGVSEVNTLTAQIAEVNGEATRLEKLGGDASSFEDQRTQLIRTLSQQIDVSVIQSDDGLTLTTNSGAPLVVGNQSFDLTTSPDASGLSHVFSNQTDITADLTGGNLAGLLKARDQGVASVLTDLNTLATGLATSLNQANQNGFDLSGVQGGNIFASPTAQDAAANFSVAMADPKGLAASLDGSVGDNKNLASFAAAQTSAVAGGQDPTDFYSGMVSRIGNDVATAQANSDAGDLMLQQLQNQRGAISGVSLDEEAANMVRFQRAFEASAKVISVVDEMMQTVIAMGVTT